MRHTLRLLLSATAVVLALLGCGGGGDGGGTGINSISVDVTGLLPGNSLSLQNNGGPSSAVAANGTFTFDAQVANGSPYAVSVSVQPVGQNCAVANGTGVAAGVNITVSVACAALSYDIIADVAGLIQNTNIVLQNNLKNDLVISRNGLANFTSAISSGSTYSVTVLTQPVGQNCIVANGTGTVRNTNVNIAINCTPNKYTVSGNVSGLITGNSVTLLNNGASTSTVSTNGAFTFSTNVASGSQYSVTVGSQPNGQNCTVSNGSGAVSGANITSVVVNCAALNFNLSVRVTGISTPNGLLLQNNGHDNLSIATSGVTNFNTPISSGSSYAVTILNQPAGRTCIVMNGSGIVVASNISVTVVCPWHVVYTASGDISASYVDATTGSLTKLAESPFIAGTANSIAAHPTGKFIYVAGTDGSVSSFHVNATTGALSRTGPILQTGNSSASVVAVDSTGRFAYVANGSIFSFSIDSNSGMLTPIAGGSLPVAGPPSLIAIDPNSRFVYVATRNISKGISGFSINSATGALSAIAGSPFEPGNATGIALDASGRFAYVSLWLGATQVLSIDSSSGVLSQIPSSPYATGTYPLSVAIDPSGTFVYVADSLLYSSQTVPNVYGYLRSPQAGSMVRMGGSPFVSGTFPNYISIDPSGRFAYVLTDEGIAVLSVNSSTGALTPVVGSPFANARGRSLVSVPIQ